MDGNCVLPTSTGNDLGFPNNISNNSDENCMTATSTRNKMETNYIPSICTNNMHHYQPGVSQQQMEQYYSPKGFCPPMSDSTPVKQPVISYANAYQAPSKLMSSALPIRPIVKSETQPKSIMKTYRDIESVSGATNHKLKTVYINHENGWRTLIILRGAPGSGKTYLAQNIIDTMYNKTNNNYKIHIFSTDQYFMRGGVYESEAHLWNHRCAQNATKQGISPVIVDNTNTEVWEMKPYVESGVKYGYIIEVLEADTPWSKKTKVLYNRCSHDVPYMNILRMLDNYQPNVTGEYLLRCFGYSYKPGMIPPVLRQLPQYSVPPKSRPLQSTSNTQNNSHTEATKKDRLERSSSKSPLPRQQVNEDQRINAFSFPSRQNDSVKDNQEIATTEASIQNDPEEEQTIEASTQSETEKNLTIQNADELNQLNEDNNTLEVIDIIELGWKNGEKWEDKTKEEKSFSQGAMICDVKPQRTKKVTKSKSTDNELSGSLQSYEDWSKLCMYLPPWVDDDKIKKSPDVKQSKPIVKKRSSHTCMEFGDTNICYTKNPQKIILAVSRDINEFRHPFLDLSIPDQQMLHKSTSTHDNHISAPTTRCKNEEQHFAMFVKLFKNVDKSLLRDIFDKCCGDVNWAVDIVLDDTASKKFDIGDNIIPPIHEIDDPVFDCECLSAYNLIPDRFVIALPKKQISIQKETPSPIKLKNPKKEIILSEATIELKRQIEENFVIPDSHYSEQHLKIKKNRRGDVYTPENVNTEKSTKSETEPGSSDSSQASKVEDQNTADATMRNGDEETYYSDLCENPDVDVKTVNVTIGTEFILKLNEIYGGRTAELLDIIKPTINIPLFLLNEINALWVESVAHQIEESSKQSELMLEQDAELAQQLAFKEEEMSLAGKAPEIPDFKEIMDMDFALSLYQKDVEDWRNKLPDVNQSKPIVKKRSSHTCMEFGDTNICYTKNPQKIILAVSRDINEFRHPFLDLSIPDQQMLHKSTSTHDNHISAPTTRCKNEEQHFAMFVKLFKNVDKSLLRDIFDKCCGDVNWAVDIILDDTASKKFDIGDNIIPPIHEIDDPVFDCECLSAYNLIPDRFVIALPKKQISIQKETPSPIKLKNPKKEIILSEATIEFKRQIEENFVIPDSHYSEQHLKMKKNRRGDVYTPENVNTEKSTKSETEPGSSDSSQASKVEDQNTADATIRNGDEETYYSDLCENPDVDVKTVNVTIGTEFILKLNEIYGGRTAELLDIIKPTINIPMFLLNEINALWVESVAHQIEESSKQSELMLEQDAELAQQLAFKEEEMSLAGKAPEIPDLKEIMDMDFALSLYQKDVEDWRNKLPDVNQSKPIVKKRSSHTCMEFGDTNICYTKNPQKIILAVSRDINEFRHPFLDLSIPDQQMLHKSTSTHDNHISAPTTRCKNEEQHFAMFVKLFKNVDKSLLRDIFDKCCGDVNWAVDIVLDDTASKKFDIGDNIIPPIHEIDDPVFDCECLSAYNLIPDRFVIALPKKQISIQKETPSPIKLKNPIKEIILSEATIELKRQIEENFVIPDSHYSEQHLKMKKNRRGDVYTPENVNTEQNTKSETEPGSSDSSQASKVEDQNTADAKMRNGDEETYYSDLCENPDVDVKTVNVTIGTEFILKLNEIYGGRTAELLDIIKPTINIPMFLLNEINALWVESVAHQIEESSKQSELMLEQDAELAQQLAFKEEEMSLAGKAPEIPDLKEIMDMDFALSLYQKDVEDWRNKLPDVNQSKPIVKKRSSHTCMEFGDTNICYTKNPQKIILAVSRDINEFRHPFLDLSIPDQQMLHKSTSTHDNHISAPTTRCKNEEQHFAMFVKLFKNVDKSLLRDIFDKCCGDVNWAVDIVLDDTASKKFDIGDNIIPPIHEIDDPVFDCECLSAYNLIPDRFVIALPKKQISIQKETPSPIKLKNPIKEIILSEATIDLKRQIEENFVIPDSHYSEQHLKMKKNRRGDVYTPENVNTEQNTKSETEPGSSDSSQASKVEDQNTADAKMRNGDEETYYSDLCENPDVDVKTVNVTIGTEFILKLNEIYGGRTAELLDIIKPTINIPMFLLNEINALWVESVAHQIEESSKQSELMLEQDAELAQQLAFKEEEMSLAGKAPEIPDLKEIMDMDFALSLYQKDVEDWRNKLPDDLAAKLSREKLYNLFPSTSSDFLSELFLAHDYNFKSTVEVILTSTGKSEILDTENGKFVMEKEMERQEKLLQEEKEALSEVEWPFLQKSDNVDMSVVQKYRDEADKHLKFRNLNYQKAQDYIRRGMTQVGSYFSEVAAFHKMKFEQANSWAAVSLMQVHAANATDLFTLDLHFLRVGEAKEDVDLFLDSHIQKLRELENKSNQYHSLFFISGRGLHSQGKPRLKPAVKKRLQERGLLCGERNPGLIATRICV